MKIDWKSFKLKRTPPPKRQFPTQTRAYKAHQGGGKTLSMVYDALQIFFEWEKCEMWSNIKIKLPKEYLNRYHYYNDMKGLLEGLSYQNGENGVLVLIDEAHLFFHKKNGISIDVLTAISQQRKDRRKIFISSQIWEDLDISLRKQVPEIIDCKNILGFIQLNTVYKGHTLHWDKNEGAYVADKDFKYIFKHNDRLYNIYDTYQKIITNKDYERAANTVLIQNTINNSMGTKKRNVVK